MLKITIRTDGGPKIGMGHITRCLALAEELAINDCNVTFITRNNMPAILKIKEYGFDVKIIDNLTIEDEINCLTQVINQFDILITDSYEIDYNYLDIMKKTGIFLVSIDDLNQHDFPCDIVINGNIYAEDLNYKNVTGKTCFLLGTRYVLMRKEFRDLPKKQIKIKPKNILITIGGSDPKGFTIEILKILMSDKNLSNLNFDVVIGPSFDIELVTDINKFTKNYTNISTYYNVNSTIMRDLMIKADIAISAGGSTLYELAAAGVPTIGIITADNQIKNVEYFRKKECIYSMGFEVNKNILMEKMNDLLNDSAKRRIISLNGQKLFNGDGVKKCAYEIINSLNKKFV